jgi:SPP1 gp7 family putative phage head morphogenesis protein
VDAALPGQTFEEIAQDVVAEVSRVIADPPLPDVETPVLAEAEKERVRVWAEGSPSMVLEFVARIDDRTSDICRECNGTRLPAGHPWWRTHTPPLHPHCRSTVVQSRGGAITTDPPEVEL